MAKDSLTLLPTSTSSNPQAALLGIPAELRSRILKHVFEDDFMVLPSGQPPDRRRIHLFSKGRSVLKVSKQLRAETETILLAHATLTIDAGEKDTSIDERILPSRVAEQIHYVCLTNKIIARHTGDLIFSPCLSSRFQLQAFSSLRTVSLDLSFGLTDAWNLDPYRPSKLKDDEVLVGIARSTVFRSGRNRVRDRLFIREKVEVDGYITLLFPNSEPVCTSQI